MPMMIPAVEQAVAGKSDYMVAFTCDRSHGNYTCSTELLPLSQVANYVKKVPAEWINDSHNGLKQDFIDYVLPLIQGEPERPVEHSLPRYARLKKILAE